MAGISSDPSRECNNAAVTEGTAKRAAAAAGEANWYKAQTPCPLHVSADNCTAAIRAAPWGLPCGKHVFFLVTNPHNTHPTDLLSVSLSLSLCGCC